jgi:hypothetical protein
MKQTYFQKLIWDTCKKESIEYGACIIVALDSNEGLKFVTVDTWQEEFQGAQPLCFFKDGKEIQVGQTFEQLLEEIPEQKEEVELPNFFGKQKVREFLDDVLPKYHSTFKKGV